MQGTAYEKLPVLSPRAPFQDRRAPGLGLLHRHPGGPLAMKNVADLYMYPTP